MARNEEGLRRALERIPELRDEFWQNVSVPGEKNNLNKNLEYAGRVADYLEFAELLALDALHRTESCGGHFREESQTPDGEALRDDEHFMYVGGLGISGRRQGAGAAQGAAGVRVREARARRSYKYGYAYPSQGLASGRPGPARAAGPLHGRERLGRHVLPRDARRRQRRADREGGGPDRLRLGLPRGHLRHLRLHGQRHPPRTGPRHHACASSTCGGSRTAIR